jgi:hypothetical protein
MKLNHYLIIIGIGLISYSYSSMSPKPMRSERNTTAIVIALGSMMIAAGTLRIKAS